MALAWREIEGYLCGLPPRLSERVRLLRVDLGVAWSATGEPADLVGTPDDLPLLQNHLRLSADLEEPSDDRRLRALSRSALLTLMLIHLHDGIRFAGSALDRTWAGTADELARTITTELHRGNGGQGSWMEIHADGWRRFHEASDTEADARTAEGVLDLGADRFAPFQVIAASVATGAGRDDFVAAVRGLLDALHSTMSVDRDLRRIRNDLARGRTSPVVGWASRKMDVDPALSSPDHTAGAVILSGAPRKLAELCRSRLTQSWSLCEPLGLSRLTELSWRVLADLEEIVGLFDLAAGSQPRTPSRERTETTVSPTPSELLETSVDAARRYLLADLTFRDSWEVHRWGLAGAEEVTAQFPAGLVLEVLARHGSPVSRLIDQFADAVRQRRLAYYDHLSLPQVDTDTLGVLLRLHGWSGDRVGHARLLEEYLLRLDRRVDPDGTVPVWLSDDQDDAVLLGEGCGVIAAGVITGLLNFRGKDRRAWIATAARRVLESFLRRGPGISVNYPPAYAVAAVAQLQQSIRAENLLEEFWGPVEEAIGAWVDRTSATRLSPQRAASLVTACLRASRPVRPEWIHLLIETQHSDGRWSGEPLFFVPHRARSVTWYASDLTTSAICYDALAAYSTT